jgi:response regulator of citrate/malate metabolism
MEFDLVLINNILPDGKGISILSLLPKSCIKIGMGSQGNNENNLQNFPYFLVKPFLFSQLNKILNNLFL